MRGEYFFVIRAHFLLQVPTVLYRRIKQNISWKSNVLTNGEIPRLKKPVNLAISTATLTITILSLLSEIQGQMAVCKYSKCEFVV